MRALLGGGSLGAAVSVVAGVVYVGWVRPWHLRWGTTHEEATLDLPGDDWMPHPMLEATRAVSVAAPAERMWPWLVQLGSDRAGLRSDDAVAGGRRARRLSTEHPRLSVGDTVPTGPGHGFVVLDLDEPRSMTMTFDVRNVPGVRMQGVVALVVRPTESGSRLVVRVRLDHGENARSRLYALLFEPGDFIMTRRMLLGIKERAEHTSAADLAAPAAARGRR